MNIGILGAGNIGKALAVHFRKLNHTVKIANSRGPSTLADVARETGAEPVDAQDVGRNVDLFVVTIQMKGLAAVSRNVWDALSDDTLIIDTCNYYPNRDGLIREIEDGMLESEYVSKAIGRPVIKVFNNIMTESLVRKGLPKGNKNRVALPVSGDDLEAKRKVIDLVEQMGFDGYDAGCLSESWRQQPGTPAYCPDPNLMQLPKLLARADRHKAPANRELAYKILENIPTNFPAEDLVRFARLFVGMDIFKYKSYLAAFSIGLAMLRFK